MENVLSNVKIRFLSTNENIFNIKGREAKISDFNILKKKGIGKEFGQLYLLEGKESHKKYIVKALDKRIGNYNEENHYFKNSIEEIFKINNPNIIKLFGHYEDNNYCYFLLENISALSELYDFILVYNYILKNKIKERENIIAKLMKGIINALKYFHNSNNPKIFGNLNLENIYFKKDFSVILTIPWRCYINEEKKINLNNYIYKPPHFYLAPEILKNEKYDEKADIWSLGVILYELITGEIPFEGNNIAQVKNNILKLNITWSKKIDVDAKDLITKILKIEPKERLSLDDIMNHKYINKNLNNNNKNLNFNNQLNINEKEKLLNKIKDYGLNKVPNRFLPIPENAEKGLEHEPILKDFEILKKFEENSKRLSLLQKYKKTNASYILRYIPKKKFDNNYPDNPYIKKEIIDLYKKNHPNIVKTFGHFENNKFCIFIKEYCSIGDLNDLFLNIKEKKISLTLKDCSSIIKDIVSAIYFIYNLKPKIIYKNIKLKLENILITKDLKAKLSDFEWNYYFRGYDDGMIIAEYFEMEKLSPEYLVGDEFESSYDIWSIGIILYRLITGQLPFEGDDIPIVEENINKANILWPENIDPDAKDLIEKILKVDPKERLNLEQIIKHNFITKYFPNAEDSLIKPEEEMKEYKPFIISKDDPETWKPEEIK